MESGRLGNKEYKKLDAFKSALYSLSMVICSCNSELPNRNLNLFKFSQQGPIFGIDYPTVRIPKLWSLEDLEIRNIKKLEAFKSALYSKLVDGYSTEVSCDNPYCNECN